MNNRIQNIAIRLRMAHSWVESDQHLGLPPVVMFDNSPKALEAALSPDTLTKACASTAIGPILHFTTDEEIAEHCKQSLQPKVSMPRIVAVKDVGLFFLHASAASVQENKEAFHEVGKIGSGNFTPPHGRMSNRVAIVTGGAQGFGKGIAKELVREGANVVIADINDAVGNACAQDLCKWKGNGCAIYCRADVGSSQSLSDLVDAAVKTFGGIDLFVANAGVLKAGGLSEMTEEAFDLVTKINYKAFFLCAQAVAPVMKFQNSCNPEYTMDIIQISSKSGLQGSNKNFAYAGSKFGGIGLVQSFALELIEFNIKVNAICPGNYYEGPLWSDPEKGLFVQYLNAGKVPGAKTIDDVKKFYLNKSPIQRGCLPIDVVKAIMYTCEQMYETGQAIPVTGGQVMLK